MQKIPLSLLAAAALVACSSLGKQATDSADTYARAIEITKKNIDSERFKIYELRLSESEELSDDLNYIVVKMVNTNDQAFSQTFFLNGLPPSPLRDVNRTFEAPEYAATKGIDLDALDPQKMADRIAEAKTMLPEGHSFQSVASYTFTEKVPAGSSFINPNRDVGKRSETFVIRFTEDGKETESNAGQTSYIYYEAKATVAPDGTVTLEEN